MKKKPAPKTKAGSPETGIPALEAVSSDNAPFPTESSGPAGIGYLVRWPEENAAEDLASGGQTAFPKPFPMEAPSNRDRSEESSGQDAASTDIPRKPMESTGSPGTARETTQDTTQNAASETEIEMGDNRVSAGSSSLDGVDSSDTILPSSRAERLPGEGRNGCWERLRKMARSAGMPRGQGPGTAYQWANDQVDRLFSKPEPVEEPPADPVAEPILQPLQNPPQTADTIAVATAPAKDDGSVSGLSELPDHWPELPANAQLQVEIAWVTANRLRVRDGTGVNLSKALSPAPSYAALSWLETSILFPAKFADISVKATAQQDDEREFSKREKMAIEEIRSILSEMLEAKE